MTRRRRQPEREPMPLAVPLEFVEAAWADASLKDTVNVALRGTVWWDSGRWSLELAK